MYSGRRRRIGLLPPVCAHKSCLICGPSKGGKPASKDTLYGASLPTVSDATTPRLEHISGKGRSNFKYHCVGIYIAGVGLDTADWMQKLKRKKKFCDCGTSKNFHSNSFEVASVSNDVGRVWSQIKAPKQSSSIPSFTGSPSPVSMLMAPSSQLLCPPFVQHVKTVFNFSFCESDLAMVTCVPCARFIKYLYHAPKGTQL